MEMKFRFDTEFNLNGQLYAGYVVFEDNSVRLVSSPRSARTYSIDPLKIGKACVRAIDRIAAHFGIQGDAINQIALVPIPAE